MSLFPKVLFSKNTKRYVSILTPTKNEIEVKYYQKSISGKTFFVENGSEYCRVSRIMERVFKDHIQLLAHEFLKNFNRFS